MSKQKTQNAIPAPWRVPLAAVDVAENGQRVDLVADEAVRVAVARVAGLRELPRLAAKFDIARRGAGGLHVAGMVSATVGQNCVVTLEPLTNEVEERVDLVFLPPQPRLREAGDDDDNEEAPYEVKLGDPEPLIDGVVDLGAIATEFLILGLDPYPRKADAVFEPPAEHKPEESPFASLARLKG